MKLRCIMISVSVLGVTGFVCALPAMAVIGNQSVGLNVHLHQRVVPAQWEDALDAVEGSGAGWAREQFSWDDIEPVEGEFDFSAYDGAVEAYRTRGIRVLGLLTYSADWASSNPTSADSEFYPPADIDTWLKFVGKTVRRYQDDIHAWEIWNEPNLDSSWQPSADAAAYADFLKATTEKIHTIDPEAKVVLGGLSGVDTDFLDQIYRRIGPGYIDIVAVHPYRHVGSDFNYAPEVFASGLLPLVTDLAGVRAVISRHGDDAPLWLTEFGWSTYADGVSEKLQAAYVARALTLALGQSGVRKAFVYTLRDDSEANNFEDRFGVVDHNFDPKPASNMQQLFTRRLNGAAFQESLQVGAQVADTLDSATGWTVSDSPHAGLNISASNGTLKLDYTFVDDNNSYAVASKSISLPTNIRAIVFQAKGDNSKNILRFRLKDTTGETFQYTVGSLPDDWTTIRLPVRSFDTAFGGDGDRTLDRPLKFDSFILDDQPDDGDSTGIVELDQLRSLPHRGLYLESFLKSEQTRYVLWNATGKKQIQIDLGAARKIRIYKLTGSRVLTSSTGKFTLTVRTMPQILAVVE